MPHASLAEFLEGLAHAGQIVRVPGQVASGLEMTEITRRLTGQAPRPLDARPFQDPAAGERAGGASPGGPAIIFERIAGQRMPVVTNLLGTRPRICRALGVPSLGEVIDRLAAALRPASGTWLDKLRQSGPFAVGHEPKTVKSGPCQQVVKLASDVNLGDLPILRHWPQDERPMLTSGIVMARCPETDQRIVCRRLATISGPRELGLLLTPFERLQRAAAAAARSGKNLPLAIVLGGDPIHLLAASAWLRADCDALAFSGFLRDKPVELVPARTIELLILADAELVIEGQLVSASSRSPAIVEHTGSGGYRERSIALPLHVTAVTHRVNAVMPVMVLGPPPHEETAVAQAVQQLLLPLARIQVPGLVDCRLMESAACRDLAIAAVQKSCPFQARQVASLLAGWEPFSRVRLLVIVDDGIDITDYGAVLGQMGMHAEPDRDFIVLPPTSRFCDPALPPDQPGSRIAIDATRKWPEERHGRSLVAVEMSDEVREEVDVRWAELGISSRR